MKRGLSACNIEIEYTCGCGGRMILFKHKNGSCVKFGKDSDYYLHICDKCTKCEYLKGKFPRIEHEG
jgi:hypothetical protein